MVRASGFRWSTSTWLSKNDAAVQARSSAVPDAESPMNGTRMVFGSMACLPSARGHSSTRWTGGRAPRPDRPVRIAVTPSGGPLERRDAGQRLALQPFEEGAARGGDVAEPLLHARLGQRRHRVARSEERRVGKELCQYV